MNNQPLLIVVYLISSVCLWSRWFSLSEIIAGEGFHPALKESARYDQILTSIAILQLCVYEVVIIYHKIYVYVQFLCKSILQ